MERIDAAAFGIFVNRADAETAVDRLTMDLADGTWDVDVPRI